MICHHQRIVLSKLSFETWDFVIPDIWLTAAHLSASMTLYILPLNVPAFMIITPKLSNRWRAFIDPIWITSSLEWFCIVADFYSLKSSARRSESLFSASFSVATRSGYSRYDIELERFSFLCGFSFSWESLFFWRMWRNETVDHMLCQKDKRYTALERHFMDEIGLCPASNPILKDRQNHKTVRRWYRRLGVPFE